MARKLLLIFASLTLIVAGGALYLSITSTNPAAGAIETRSVLVAAGDLPPGTLVSALTDKQVRLVLVAPEVAPPNALDSLKSVAKLKTTVPIFKGQVLMERQFAESSATGGLPIPKGKNAVSAELSDPARVAGFVQPGSSVVVYVQDQKGGDRARVLLSAASVIAIGPSTISEPGTNQPNGAVATTIVTFALTPLESTKIIQALGSADGTQTLYLGLLPE